MTDELPAIGSVWGVPGDTEGWVRVNAADGLTTTCSVFVGEKKIPTHSFPPAGAVRIDNDDAAKLAYLKTKGLTVGWAKDSGKEPYLQYVIEPGHSAD